MNDERRRLKDERRTRRSFWIFLIFAIFMFFSCDTILQDILGVDEKFELPPVPQDTTSYSERFIQINPAWDGEFFGFSLDSVQDIHIGMDQLIYIADTGNDRILMLDKAGNLQGERHFDNPLALSQDSRLNLLVANGTNTIFRIRLAEVNHVFADAPIDTIDENWFYGWGESFIEDYFAPAKFVGVAAFGDEHFYATDAFGNLVWRFCNECKTINDSIVYPTFGAILYEGSGLGTTQNPMAMTSFFVPGDDPSETIQNSGCLFTQNGDEILLQGIQPVENGAGYQSVLPADMSMDYVSLFSESEIDNQLKDVTVDRYGNIYVADATGNKIWVFDKDGNQKESETSSDSHIQYLSFGDENLFDSPAGITYNSGLGENILYVADTGNNRILRFKLTSDFDNWD